MNLDTAMNEFDKTNVQVNELIVKREKLKSLILNLQNNTRADTGQSVFRMDAENDDLSPRQKLKLDTEDMWKKDYSNNDLEREDKSYLSPRAQMIDELSEMWK